MIKSHSYHNKPSNNPPENYKGILLPYYKHESKIEIQALMTSFGKMILNRNDTSPRYSFGSEPKSVRGKRDGTEYLYFPALEKNYKYTKDPLWKFGTSPKSILIKGKYNYYDIPYNSRNDFDLLQRKWSKPIGGDIGCEKKYRKVFKEKIPGPGRYNHEIEVDKDKGPSFGIGQKVLRLENSTNCQLSPCSYEIANKSHYHKFPHSQLISFGKDSRKVFNMKNITKHDTYHAYSSLGEQISSCKSSQPYTSFAKTERFKLNKSLH